MITREAPSSHLLLLGGGHAHIGVLRQLGMNPQSKIKVTLVSPARTSAYSGLLPAVVAGHYAESTLEIDLGALCQFAGADFLSSSVIGIDPAAQEVTLEGRPPVSYDRLSIDIGIQSNLSGLVSYDTDLIAVKPINGFMKQFNELLLTYAGGGRYAVVGGGAAGIELAFALRYRLGNLAETLAQPFPEVILCQSTEDLLPEAPAAVRQRLTHRLAESGIAVRLGFNVVRQGDGQLMAENEACLSCDKVFWVTGGAPHACLRESGLALSDKGFVAVDEMLRSTSHPNVFVAGDAAESAVNPRPKAGVYAVRQAPILYHNLLAESFGQPLKPFKAQRRHLSLLSMGGPRAIGYRGVYWAEGDWVWRLKQWIDHRFLARYRQLSNMTINELDPNTANDPSIQCRGCGAKVAGSILKEVLSEIDPDASKTMADAAVVTPPSGHLMVQSVDSFRPIIDDPFLLAKIAIVHAASDVVAMGGRLGPVMLDVTVPYSSAQVTRTLLRQVLAGAAQQISEEGGHLVGGHTSEGLELNISVSVTGWVTEADLKPAGGARLEDRLILTQPLGTGILFANAMRGAAEPAWIDEAVAMMLQSNRLAAEVIERSDVHAVTDVTGFGLAGHLEQVLSDAQGATIKLSSLPVLEGAAASLRQGGVLSTAHSKNQQMIHRQMLQVSAPEWQNPLMFDPQTSGGLLLSVSEAAAPGLLMQIKKSGFTSAKIIGRVTDTPGVIELS